MKPTIGTSTLEYQVYLFITNARPDLCALGGYAKDETPGLTTVWKPFTSARRRSLEASSICRNRMRHHDHQMVRY